MIIKMFNNRMILPTFVNTYKDWCAKHKLLPIIDDIPNTDVQGFWIGNKGSAKYAMVYFHGGGFVMPGTTQHVEMLQRFMEWSNGDLVIFCPCYSLAPDAVYPTQLGQAVESLRYVLSLPSRSPETTLLGGDSAGGNLVLAVLSHISGHPHPQYSTVKPFDMDSPLRGALAIGPWVSSDGTKFKSITEFHNVDVVTSGCANYWKNMYKGEGKNTADDNYIVPELAPSSWWSGLKTSNIIITAGGVEIFRDCIVVVAERIKEAAGGVDMKIAIGKTEVHVATLTAKSVKDLDRLGDDCQETAIRKWIKATL